MILLAAGAAWAADVSLTSGLAFPVAASYAEADPRFHGGLLVGHDFGLAPARFEAQATFATTPREGADEVTVRGTLYETAVFGGVRGELAGGKRVGFGVDALAGPALVWRHTRSVVFGEASGSLSLVPRAALAAGPWLRLGPAVVAVRGQVYAPIAPQWLAYVSVGIAL